jgi:hypothetical protein
MARPISATLIILVVLALVAPPAIRLAMTRRQKPTAITVT